jgi:DegV family protein with EDD domain
VLPETAAPSPGQFEQAYRALKAEGATAVVVIALSSDLSATMQSSELGARAVAGDIDVRIVDSRNATMGLGLMVLECAEQAKAGASADDIVALANSIAPRIRVYGALDTIENLKKGGRISGAKALMASALSIKPIVQVADGLIGEAGKQRTRSKALAFIVEKVRENASNIQRLGLLHAQCSDIDAVIAMIKEVYPKDFVVTDIGAVIGTHTGEGTVGVAFILAA